MKLSRRNCNLSSVYNKNMVAFVLLFFTVTLTSAYDIETHKQEVLVERFRYGDYYFVFYSKEANWAEAYTICQATRSRLAVVNTPERAKFLAECLSQTKVGFEDVWIGGRFAKDDWQWVPTGKTIDKPSSDNFPPWLSYPTQRGKHCLSLDRKDHWYPLFVGLKCNLYRPFICEESVSGSIDNIPEKPNEVVVNSHRYFFYHARVTWEEALVYCKQIGTRLATISDLDTATRLVELMKRSRPPFENVWIGAKRDYMGWVWVATDQALSNETTRKTGFPPWKFNYPMDPVKSCVMLDHHVCLKPDIHIHIDRHHACEEPVFMEEYCSLKRDFLCETPIDENIADLKPNLVRMDQKTYIFYDDAMSWENAKATCERINMTLATPEAEDELTTLVTHMGDMPRALYHVWLGGKWVRNKWMWLTNHSIALPNPNASFPPWCFAFPVHQDHLDCLNLDRDDHNVPLIYGFNCSTEQPFVCELDGDDFLISDDLKIRLEYHRDRLNHFEAERACTVTSSHLPIVNSYELAQKVALLIPRDTLVWIGARHVDGAWRWLPTYEIVPDVEDEETRYPPWDSAAWPSGQPLCLAMKTGYQDRPRFVEQSCKAKLHYMCQYDKKELPQPTLRLEVNGITHYFYENGVPWSEAMTICNSGSLYLANVGSLEMAKFIMNGMKNVTSLWTSGKQLSPGSWTWITSGSMLPTEVNQGYPPWLNNTVHDDMLRTCLELNNTGSELVFAGEDCLQNRSFVCIDKILMQNETEIEMNNLTITLHDMITNIANAKKMCLAQGKTVVDFTKLDNENLKGLLKSEKVKSLWVDVIYNPEGKWVYADSQKEFETEIDFPERNAELANDPKSCLTLGLTSEDTLILKPAFCSDFSRIICMSVETNQTDLAPTRVETILNGTNTNIIAILDNKSIEHSLLVCNDLGGEIVTEELTNEAIEFFKTLHSKFKKFWLDAKYKEGYWRWRNDVPVRLDGLPKVAETNSEDICLIYDRSAGQLAAANCNDKFSTVCKQVIGGKCDPKNPQEDHVQWPASCVGGPVESGTVCRATCPPNSGLVGPEFDVCYMGKWSETIKVSCQTETTHGRDLNKLITEQILIESKQTYFLFVLDIGVSKNEFRLTLQFAKNLANTIFLSNNRRTSLELYSYNSKVIDFLEYNNCHLINTVNSLDKTPHLSNSQPNYYGALLTAEQEFADKEVTNGTGYIFFFAMRPDAGSMNRTLVIDRLRARGVTIIAVSVGDAVTRNQLEEIASVKYGALQLYSFRSKAGMKDASEYLRKRCKFHARDCRLYGI